MKNIYISEVDQFVQLGETAEDIVQQIEIYHSKLIMESHLHKAIEHLVSAIKAEHEEYHNKELSNLSLKLIKLAQKFELEIGKERQIVNLYQEVYGGKE